MKKVVAAMGIVVLVVLLACPAFASIAQFAGKWKNTDTNTRGVTALDIAVNGNAITVHAWGQCHPTDCDWGTVPGFAYGPNVSANLAATATAVTAFYKTAFSETFLVIHHSGPDRPLPNTINKIPQMAPAHLKATVYTRFTDNSNRSSYTDTYVFAKAAAPHPVALTAPVQVSPASGSVFNNYPRTTKLEWKPVIGAASYSVEIEYLSPPAPGKWMPLKLQTGLNTNSFTFDFVGAQPGHWRVWAVGPNGQPGPKSPWWEFKYTK